MDLAYDDIEVGERIGGGAHADVYLAAARADGRTERVALKEPRFQGNRTVERAELRRFADEAEHWDRLDDDDRVVGVVDWDEQPMPWLALEYMDAGSLRRYLDDGDWGLEQACWTAAELAAGVKHAHDYGIAHLDLKPENVLFRETDGWPAPKIGDWGLARLAIAEQSSTAGMTPAYAAPEQFDSAYGEKDTQTDVYQLGTVVYELLAGRPPFEGEPGEVMRQVLGGEPVPVRERNPEVPAALNDAVMGALATDKADRDDSVVYLRDELRNAFAGMR